MALTKHLFASVIFALLLSSAAFGQALQPVPKITVFAAASMQNVVKDLAETFKKEHKVDFVFNFAGTNTLSRQIKAGAKADIFIAANKQWMNYAGAHILTDTMQFLMTNGLVVIKNKDAKFPSFDNEKQMPKLDFRYLAVANPGAVPAGKYAHRHFSAIQDGKMSVWSKVRKRLAPYPDVRAALHAVENDKTLIGIVYNTDAKTSDKIEVLFSTKPGQVPVKYTSGVLKNSTQLDMAKKFNQFLVSAEADKLYTKHGFLLFNKRPPYDRR